MIDTKKFYINGAWVAPISDREMEVIDPSTEQACGTIAIGNQADTDAAVAAAKAAFDDWSQTPKARRIALLKKFLTVYQARNEEMGRAISLEMGAPIDMALTSQAESGSEHTAGLIEELEKFEFERALNDSAPNDRIIYEAIGVCALITPWNWPMNQVSLKAIAAMAAGCTMVLKPSEIAPLSSLVFADMVHEAGIPAGVFNMVNGDGAGVGSHLTSHPDVDMVSFTGSTRAGALISKNAADTVKRVALELGGKGANIVFADADEKAIERGIYHCFGNSGQSCNAPTRMLVERSFYDQAVVMAKAAAAKVQVGRATEHGNHIGPVVSELQYNKIQALIKVGIDEGANVAVGGLGKPQGLETGYFVKPTIFTDVNNDMQIAREEVFGPVLCMIPFDTEEQAIAIANDTVFGLTNYIQTQDSAKANRVARRLRSGMVQMNGTFRSAGAPFGGYKQSGNGREGGVWGLEDFLEVKSISGWSNA